MWSAGDGFGGGDDVEEEGAAADLVEDLGALAFEPRAFACGHDGDGDGRRGEGFGDVVEVVGGAFYADEASG
jgi:hypothetical protein